MILKQKRTLDYTIGIDVHIKDAYGLKSVLRDNIMIRDVLERMMIQILCIPFYLLYLCAWILDAIYYYYHKYIKGEECFKR